MQAEAVGYTTSYIPTTSAPVTRAADLLRYPIASVTGFDQTKGSLQLDYILEGATSGFSAPAQFIGASPHTDFIDLDEFNTGSTTAPPLNTASAHAGGVNVGNCIFSPVAVGAGAVHRGASSWALGGVMNGAHDGVASTGNSGTVGSLPTIVNLTIGGPVNFQSPVSLWARRVRCWPRALSPAELVTETFVPGPTSALSCGPMLADGVVTDATNNSANIRRRVQVSAVSGVTDIVVAIPGSYFGAAETPIPAPLTIAAASVEYPSGVFYQLFASGSPSLTITPGATMTRFDPLSITIPAGDHFWVKLFVRWTP
jgi:hypothetical protein